MADHSEDALSFGSIPENSAPMEEDTSSAAAEEGESSEELTSDPSALEGSAGDTNPSGSSPDVSSEGLATTDESASLGPIEHEPSSANATSSSESDASHPGAGAAHGSTSDDAHSEADSVSDSDESPASDESDELESDESDESYRPPNVVRRSNRLAGRAAPGPPAPAPVPVAAAPAVGSTTVVTEQLKRYKSERDLARNEAMRFKEEAERLREQLNEANVEMAKVLSQSQEDFGVLAGEGRVPKTDMHKIINKPVAYDGGNDKCHIVDWLAAMMHYLLVLGVPVALYVTTAASYLKGEALRFWLNRMKALTEQQRTSWQVFKESLLERFDSENTAASARMKLDRLQQNRMPMAKFVQRFDNIASYIPDIGDADLIHRFLEAVNPEHKIVLQNDPSSGVRWTEYAKLRKYALNMFPAVAEAGRRQNKPVATNLTKRPFAGAARTDSARTMSELADFNRKRMRGQETAAAGAQRPQNENRSWDYKNSAGQLVTRNAAQRRAIMAAHVCGFCYKAGHSASDCRAQQPAKGLPAGPSNRR